MNHKNTLNGIIFLTIVVMVTLCVLFLDIPLASWIDKHLMAKAPFVKRANIPDLLLTTVVILTSLSTVIYIYLASLKIHNRLKLFCLLTGIVLPLSMMIKAFLKWLFGKTESRNWLCNQTSYEFHWFAGSDGFAGFPSGHMLVLTPLFMALWHFYPRYRPLYGMGWLCLGAALIVTEYHFLSDVIAGAYVGTVVYLLVSAVLKSPGLENRNSVVE